jgi:hypothetical protein
VLFDLGTVVDRHVPAAEIDHPGIHRAVSGIQNRFLQHINPLQALLNASSRNGKGVKRKTQSCVSPLCPDT